MSNKILFIFQEPIEKLRFGWGWTLTDLESTSNIQWLQCFKIFITIFILEVYEYFVCVYVWVPCICSAQQGQKKASDTLGLEFQMVVTTLGVLGSEVRSSGKAMSVLSLWGISSARVSSWHTHPSVGLLENLGTTPQCGNPYLAAFTRDDAVVDPRGFVATNFAWYHFNLCWKSKRRHSKRP